MRSLPLLVSYPSELQSVESLAADLGFSPEHRELALKLYAMGIPPLVDRRCLPYLFGVSGRFIAAIERGPEPYYRIYSIKKAGGGTRKIEAPRRFLKLIQTWINAYLCSHAKLPKCVTGFVKGKNIFDNARPHAGATNLMVVDIKDFFPSVTLDKVVAAFATIGLGQEVSRQLGRLCCLGGRLPQGAPSSPALANIAFAEADKVLLKQAKMWECRYTRYADDLAFSGSKRFSQEDVARVAGIVGEFGFSINQKKTRIIGQGGRQIVAGIVVNRKTLPPRAKRRLWRAILHRASRRPHEFSGRASILLGLASFVNQFSPKLGAKYKAIGEQVRRLEEA